MIARQSQGDRLPLDHNIILHEIDFRALVGNKGGYVCGLGHASDAVMQNGSHLPFACNGCLEFVGLLGRGVGCCSPFA